MTAWKRLAVILSLIGLLTLGIGSSPILADVSPDGWASQSGNTTLTLYSAWGTSSSDMFACGAGGVILHYDGASWNQMTSGVTSSLFGVWGSSTDDVFAVGQGGVIIHYDGAAWTSMVTYGTHLKGVWGSSSDNVFAVGNGGLILNYDGASWSPMSSSTTLHLSAVWGSASNDVFVVGNGGAILHYNGTAWSSVSAVNQPNLFGVWGSSSKDVFVVGNDGAIFQYSVDNWTTMTSGVGDALYGVWGTAADDVFAVGLGGTILHYDGTDWATMSSGTTFALRSVRGFSSLDAFAVGDGGTILHYKELGPIVLSVTPNEGNQGETIPITITGNNFTGITDVSFGEGTTVDGYQVDSVTQISANITISASALTGPRTVSITGAEGTGSLGGGFVIPYPSLTDVTPGSGYVGETVDLVITGVNLGAATGLSLGVNININGFTVDSPTSISGQVTISDIAAFGLRGVSVITPSGTAVLANAFDVLALPPEIAGVSPDFGSQGQSLSVLISGANLGSVSAVDFGAGVSVNSLSSPDVNSVLVEIQIASDASPGTRDVSLSTPGGTTSLPQGFEILPPSPTLTGASPNTGKQGDRVTVVISGTNLTGATSIAFGSGVLALGIIVNSFTVDSSTQITADISIAGSARTGVRDIVVETPLGSPRLLDGFTVDPGLPAVSSLGIDSGYPGEELAVVVRGTNLSGCHTVTFGQGITVTRLNVIDATTLVVNIVIDPGADAGPRNVTLTNQSGSYTVQDGFTVMLKEGALPIWIWLLAALALALLGFLLFIVRRRRAARASTDSSAGD